MITKLPMTPNVKPGRLLPPGPTGWPREAAKYQSAEPSVPARKTRHQGRCRGQFDLENSITSCLNIHYACHTVVEANLGLATVNSALLTADCRSAGHCLPGWVRLS